ncbi:MAG: DUF2341 domain-containing protein [Chloroflexi bacterium]|nr:DUF2341 domain-containing protein [Chloroflexota bacterium]
MNDQNTSLFRRDISKLVSVGTLFLLLAVLLLPQMLPPPAQAEIPPTWDDTDWDYRRVIELTENSGSALTDYPVKITLTPDTFNYNNVQGSNGDDLRFTTSSGTACSYWIETWNNSGTSSVWVKYPSLPSSGTSTFHMYYGNPTANAVSSGTSVFTFFDDFDGASLDTDVWTATSPANVTVADGGVRINKGSIYTKNTVAQSDEMIFESMVKWYASTGTWYSGMMTVDVKNLQAGNAGADANVCYMVDYPAGSSVNYFAGDGTVASYNLGSGVPVFTRTAQVDYVLGTGFDGTNIRLFSNYVEKVSLDYFNESVYMYLGFFLGSGAGSYDIQDIYVSWARARKFIEDEPTFELGAEESTTSWGDSFSSTVSISTSSTNTATSGGDTTLVSNLVETTYSDSFNLSNWDGNGLTSLDVGGTAYHDDYACLRSQFGGGGVVTSDDIDLSSATSASLDFWFRKYNTAATGFTLYFFNGSTYDIIDELDNNGGDWTWLHYNDVAIDLGTYGISNFRIRIDCTNAIGHSAWVDDVVLTVDGETAFSDSFTHSLWDGTSPWSIKSGISRSGNHSMWVKNGVYAWNYLTSDTIDLSNALTANLDFWFYKLYTATYDFRLEYYNGSSWTVIDYLDNNGSDWAWLRRNAAIDLDTYGNSSFKLRLGALLGGTVKKVWFDDLVFTKTFNTYSSSGTVSSVGIAPSSLSNWDSLGWSDTEPTNTDIKIRLEYYSGGSWQLIPDGDLSGNAAGFDSSPVDLMSLNTGTYSEVRLAANLSTTDTLVTPTLHDWNITWNDWSDGKFAWDKVDSTSNITVGNGIASLTAYGSPGTITSTDITISGTISWDTFSVNHGTPAGTGIEYKILDASDDSVLCTISGTEAAIGYDISKCAGSINPVKAYAELTSDGGDTPTLKDWLLSWQAPLDFVLNSVVLWDTGATPSEATSITPQVEYNTRVRITKNDGTLNDLSTVKATLFYDSDGSYAVEDVPGSGNTQTAAILAWTNGGSPVWSINPDTSTTWSINSGSCSAPSLSSTEGTFQFYFTPGKVASETTGSAKWHIYGAANSGTLTANNYQDNLDMNWYGEINSITSSFGFGSVSLGDTDIVSTSAVSATYISNGAYDEQVKSDASWIGQLTSTALSLGTEFSLKADDDNTVADAVSVASASYTSIDTSGTQTAEAGVTQANNYLWLTTDSGIPADEFQGSVYFGIGDGS